MDKEETWIKHYWRPIMAYQYALVCLFDFIIAPVLTMLLAKATGAGYIQWVPLTLQDSGFYHLSMAAIIGVAAWTRGQEKITRLGYDGSESVRESSTMSQTPTGN